MHEKKIMSCLVYAEWIFSYFYENRKYIYSELLSNKTFEE